MKSKFRLANHVCINIIIIIVIIIIIIINIILGVRWRWVNMTLNLTPPPSSSTPIPLSIFAGFFFLPKPVCYYLSLAFFIVSPFCEIWCEIPVWLKGYQDLSVFLKIFCFGFLNKVKRFIFRQGTKNLDDMNKNFCLHLGKVEWKFYFIFKNY